MTTSPEQDRERIEDEAATWLIALAEAPEDSGLRRRFEAWHGASDLHAEIWARTRRAYGFAGEGTSRHRDHWDAYAAERDTRRDLPLGRAQAARPARFRRIAPVAAALALAACLAFAIVPDVLLRMTADVVTATGEVLTLDLADGSRVRLSPESAVEVAYTDAVRRVRLIKGEAFFEITRDPSRPFRVAAGDTTAIVLGTAFDVRRGDAGARVAVREGRVRVEDASTFPPTRAELTSGDWIRVTWRGGAVQGRAPADEVAAWLWGDLVVRDRPVDEVVDALRPYFRGAILVQSRRFVERRVSGIYSLRDPVATLSDLAASHGAVTHQISPWLLIVSDW